MIEMDDALLTYLSQGGPQNVHLICAHAVLHSDVITALARFAKAAFVELKRPLETTSSELGSATGEHSGCGAQSSSVVEQRSDLVSAEALIPKVQWSELSRRRVWVVCQLRPDDEASSTVDFNITLLRRVAVDILCTRTFACHSKFKVIVLATVQQLRQQHFPRILLHLTGVRPGTQRLLEISSSNGVVGTTATATLIESEMEEWLNYEDCEDVSGRIAQLQEDVFNGVSQIERVTYDQSMGKGGPFIRVMRDALKFSIVVNTLDMTKSLAGDVLYRCLASILHTSRKLHTLILSECSITDVGAAELALSLRTAPFVKKLVLSRNPQITDMGIAALASAFTAGSQCVLEVLDMSRNNSVYSEERQWSSASLCVLWDALGENQTLTDVNLSECELQARDVLEMARRWIAKTTALKTLDVSDNAFGDVAAAILLEHIQQISDLNLSHTGISGSGFRAAAFALSRGKPLQRIRFDSNNTMLAREMDLSEFRDEDGSMALSTEMAEVLVSCGEETAIETFIRSLIDNTTLTELSLARVNIGDKGVSLLCDLLLHRQCVLKRLNISGNCNIDEVSAHRIKELIWGGYLENKSSAPADTEDGNRDDDNDDDDDDHSGMSLPALEALSLAGNSTNIGERALLALYKNRGLRVLDVTDMAMNDAMMLPFAEAVIANPFLCLSEVHVGGNFLFADGVKSLAVLVEHSKTLTILGLSRTWQSFTDEAGRQSSLSRTREQGHHYMRPLLAALSQTGSSAPTLKILDLSFNDVNTSLASAFVEALVHNTNMNKLLLLGNPHIQQEVAARDGRLVLSPQSQ